MGVIEFIEEEVRSHIDSKNYFLIKYSDDKFRKEAIDIILKLINKYEIFDFHIEEKEAFKESKVFYNYHTLFTKENINNKEYIYSKFLDLSKITQ
jgi:MinD-like ATPase involved in chromosome partitioning or flagellar assembly